MEIEREEAAPTQGRLFAFQPSSRDRSMDPHPARQVFPPHTGFHIHLCIP
jgi:hypothetical protein